MSSQFNSARRRERDEHAWLFAAGFIAVLSGGLAWLSFSRDLVLTPDVGLALALAGVVIALCTPPPVQRFFWHTLANRVGVARPRELAMPIVVDGDTIDDFATGVRYRIANIDAPETGDNAKCFKERERGEISRQAVIQLFGAAQRIEVRQTWRIDRYGRRVAFVLVDGEDLGRILVKRGLAVLWRGQRNKWCGKSGGLARMARAGAAQHACNTCRTWR